MTSDKERREAAENLRRFLSVPYDERGWDRTDLQTVGRLIGTPIGGNIIERLADLIDRPTCRDLVEHKPDPFVPGKRMTDGVFQCSSCGWYGRIYEYIGFGDMLAYEAVFCPKCGEEIER